MNVPLRLTLCAVVLVSGVGSCSGKGAARTGTGGASGAPGGAGTGGAGGAGGAGAAGAAGAAGETGGAPVVLPDPCRGTALPADGHYVAPGLCARTVASGLGNLRQITFASNGDLWGVTSAGQIKRFRDANDDGVFQSSEIVDWATTGGNGQNVHIDETAGYLYSGTPSGVARWAWSNTTDAGGVGEDVVTGQPGGGHGKHSVRIWDGWLYLQTGSAGNVTGSSTSSYDTSRNLIKRFALATFKPGTPFDWMTGGEIFADGIRNVLGIARDGMGRLYGVQNGQDDVTYQSADVHNDNPGEAVLRLEPGSHHGYPFCFVAERIDNILPGTQVRSEIFPGNTHDDAWCQNPANAARPATFLPAHTAPMDIAFFTGPAGVLPERWRGGAFVTLHGSWNRSPPGGYRVVWIPFNADGTAPMPTTTGTTTTFPHEVVLSAGNAGASQEGQWSVADGEQNVRPVGIAISPIDGALYISSDSQGYIYRVGLRR